ncbi:unnamed protein product [Polarella glacialis]|uniref:SAM-dependent MTase RsmB/NOP-type domain-containing protein n=1 Tax=Polarella glacialis TaxID=89957 RepID=A0A813F3N4_POLGL|nr:unnamed protein product [Polarella glacialis]
MQTVTRFAGAGLAEVKCILWVQAFDAETKQMMLAMFSLGDVLAGAAVPTARLSASASVLLQLPEQRRSDFDHAGFSVWQLSNDLYSGTEGCRAWTEREGRNGSLSFQEMVSLVPALLLDPGPSQLCIDMCAAPGSKSQQLLQIMRAKAGKAEPEGLVVSADVSAQRACLALYRVLSNAESPASCAALANAKDFPHMLDPTGARLEFGGILADVPCSGDGTARKNGQIWRSWARKEALGLHSLQRNILLRALHLMPPGGTVVYSTCSLNPVENEAVVLWCLRKWRSKENVDVELLDTPALCLAKCGISAAPGLDRWVVPSPQRGGPLFSSWQEVPEELKGDGVAGTSLRQEMFADGCDDIGGFCAPKEMARCARLYPHRGDYGGFFVAVLRKGFPPAGTPAVKLTPIKMGDRGAGKKGNRGHPLMTSQFGPVRREDPWWAEIVKFFGVNAAWAEERLQKGLFFWQRLHGNEFPERLLLVSEAVAKLWAAVPAAPGRQPAWVRLGVILFEQLPKGFQTQAALSRWRISSEGAPRLGAVLGSRRACLPAGQLLAMLRAEHRQMDLELFSPQLLQLLVNARPEEGGTRYDCGAVLLGVEGLGLPGWETCWLPAVLTPRFLRLLVDDDASEGLAEAMEEDAKQQIPLSKQQVHPAPVSADHPAPPPGCWAGLAKAAHELCSR